MPGELSFSFVPEYSAVYLHASAPSDGRRVPISIRISDTAGLRAVLDKLEALTGLAEVKAFATRSFDRMDGLITYKTPDGKPQQARPSLPIT